MVWATRSKDGRNLKLKSKLPYILLHAPLLVKLLLVYDCSMIAVRGNTLVELDRRASEQDQPFGIITADCSSPHEYDDGVSVTPLPSAEELYRVHVFAVDTSSLYRDEETVKRVLTRTESVYEDIGSKDERYHPMLDRETITRLHFVAGKVRRALSVQFLVGIKQPPSLEGIYFGRVAVEKNFNYKEFGYKCRYSERMQSFGRAAALLLGHLQTATNTEEIEDVYNGLIHVPTSASFRRGAYINQAFMIGANHLVARQMRDEQRLAIYRTHDIQDNSAVEFKDPRIAHFSARPGWHAGLDLDAYTRVTSPLRRGEDFVMHGLLRARSEERQVDSRDHRIVSTAIQRLNQRIMSQLFHGQLGKASDDTLPLSVAAA